MFSVGYVMGEGRAQCYAAAAAAVLLARAALAASLRARASLARLQAGAPGGAGPAQLQRLLRACRPLRALANGAAMLVCNALLQASGLVDRLGQDPHDKSQPTVELMGPGAAQLGWPQVARVQLPLLLLPALFYWVCGALGRGGDAGGAVDAGAGAAGGPQRGSSIAGLCRGLLPKLLAAAVVVEYGLASAYWQVQMFDTTKQSTLGGLVGAAGWPGLGKLPPRLQAPLRAALAVAGSVASMPLRLLLPQAVYWAAILAALLTGVVLAASGGCDGGSQQQQQRFVSSVLVGTVAVFSGPLVLLLGYAGPGTLLIGMVQCVCFVGLLQQRYAADLLSAACHQPGSGSPVAAGEADRCSQAEPKQQQQLGAGCGAVEGRASSSTGAAGLGRLRLLLAGLAGSKEAAGRDLQLAVLQGRGQYCGVGGVAWMIFGMQLFFCTQHFCEFTGLQYTSPFVGFDDVEWYRGFAMMSVNSFGTLMIAAAALPLLALAHIAHSSQLLAELRGLGCAQGVGAGGRAGLLAGFEQASAAFSVVRSLCMAMAMLASVVMLRHILMWAIFAPKLLFEVLFAAWVDSWLLAAAWVLRGAAGPLWKGRVWL
jgi:hypothetical protein